MRILEDAREMSWMRKKNSHYGSDKVLEMETRD